MYMYDHDIWWPWPHDHNDVDDNDERLLLRRVEQVIGDDNNDESLLLRSVEQVVGDEDNDESLLLRRVMQVMGSIYLSIYCVIGSEIPYPTIPYPRFISHES